MSKIFFKIIIGLFCVILIIQVFERIYLSWDWGNRQLYTKVTYLQSTENKHNTFFLGSSNTYRQIIPSLFDSTTIQTIHSFNLGNDGCYPAQNFSILNSLDKLPNTIKYVFFELDSPDHLAGVRYRSTKAKYFEGTHSFIFRVRYLLSSDLPILHKLSLLKKYSISLVDNLFKLGMRRDIIDYLYSPYYSFGLDLLGKHEDGFLALDGDIAAYATRERLKKVMDIHTQGFKDISKQDGAGFYNEAYLSYLLSHIKKLEEKNIHLIYILPPKGYILDSTASMVNLLNKLPKKHRIDLSNPTIFPELYLVENRWDGGHLNGKGARLYTEALVKEFNEVLETLR